jgi:hypothetical protein
VLDTFCQKQTLFCKGPKESFCGKTQTESTPHHPTQSEVLDPLSKESPAQRQTDTRNLSRTEVSIPLQGTEWIVDQRQGQGFLREQCGNMSWAKWMGALGRLTTHQRSRDEHALTFTALPDPRRLHLEERHFRHGRYTYPFARAGEAYRLCKQDLLYTRCM